MQLAGDERDLHLSSMPLLSLPGLNGLFMGPPPLELAPVPLQLGNDIDISNLLRSPVPAAGEDMIDNVSSNKVLTIQNHAQMSAH